MQRMLRKEDEGVAAAVATMFVLLIVLILLQVTVIGAVPAQQYDAEYSTTKHDIQQMDFLRSMIVGPAVAGAQVSVPFALGTQAVSPFATASAGTLSYAASDTAGVSVSFAFVPQFRQASVKKIDQDVILLMDDSGSMAQNDPQNLRIVGAQNYVGRLSVPDCVAIVAFNGNSWLTQANIGGVAHHLYYPGMCGNPDYTQPKVDLGTISDIDSTNIGRAIMTGNNELIANGHKGKAWVEILLTDGQNECGGSVSPCGDAYTVQQAQIAKANNITIFTIGLCSSGDGPLLTQIASITGGTYYAAPTAASIKWIYFEISMHYQSSVQCGNVYSAEAYGGSLSLDLNNIYYPSQALRFESGGLAAIQPDGAVMRAGFPLEYTSYGDGSGSLQVALVTLTGSSFQSSGGGTHVLEANVLARQVVDQNLTKVNLASEAQNVANISSNLAFWVTQGAATPAGAAAVNQPLNASQANLLAANTNMVAGDPVSAHFNVDQATTNLAIALNVTETQKNNNNIQGWLAQTTEDSILLEECRVGQWANWYTGLTITIITSAPSAWASWFNTTMPEWKIPFDLGISGNTVVVSLHALNRIITDRRVVSLSAM
ncbi:MAG TPA: vWA domain-containing protein [Thermoplasmata archaeon]|nr:vWA domain-containing protein [Thermoplasmata archaeon]